MFVSHRLHGNNPRLESNQKIGNCMWITNDIARLGNFLNFQASVQIAEIVNHTMWLDSSNRCFGKSKLPMGANSIRVLVWHEAKRQFSTWWHKFRQCRPFQTDSLGQFDKPRDYGEIDMGESVCKESFHHKRRLAISWRNSRFHREEIFKTWRHIGTFFAIALNVYCYLRQVIWRWNLLYNVES